MNRPNLVLGGVFVLLGTLLVLSAWQFPAGMGRLPGPGFFPLLIGAAILGLASLLIAISLRSAPTATLVLANRKQLAWTTALILVYLMAWGWVPFPVRTAAFVVVLLRLLGHRWRASVTVAAVLTTAVVLAFQYGLRVDLH